jgi:hypothetical protein
MEESLKDLLLDIPHWQFELITTLVFDTITLVLIIPLWKRWNKHHNDDHTELDDIKDRLTLLEKHGE